MFHSLIIKITFLVSSILVSVGLTAPIANVNDVATTTPTQQVEVQATSSSNNAVIVPDQVEAQAPAPADEQIPFTISIPVDVSGSNIITNSAQPVEIQMATTKEKLFYLTPQEGSPLKTKDGITLEEMRAYVLSMNPDVVAFRKQTENATEAELVKYLQLNGFIVQKK